MILCHVTHFYFSPPIRRSEFFSLDVFALGDQSAGGQSVGDAGRASLKTQGEAVADDIVGYEGVHTSRDKSISLVRGFKLIFTHVNCLILFVVLSMRSTGPTKYVIFMGLPPLRGFT